MKEVLFQFGRNLTNDAGTTSFLTKRKKKKVRYPLHVLFFLILIEIKNKTFFKYKWKVRRQYVKTEGLGKTL